MEQDENLNHLCFNLSRPGYPTIASRYLICQSPSTYYSDCNNCPRYLVDGRPICWIESIICVNFMLKVSFEQPLEKQIVNTTHAPVVMSLCSAEVRFVHCTFRVRRKWTTFSGLYFYMGI
jgi:hypothetical protein